MKRIPLSKAGKHAGKYEAIISDIDEDLLNYNWMAVGASLGRKYVNARNNSIGSLNRLIMSRIIKRAVQEDERVVYRNNNNLDNRRSNLVLVTPLSKKDVYPLPEGIDDYVWYKDLQA